MTPLTRREFLKRTAVAGAGVALLSELGINTAYAVANSDKLRKWAQPLRGLGNNGIPIATSVHDPVWANTEKVELVAGEFTDKLHPDLPPTRLWGYYDKNGAIDPLTNQPIKRHLGGIIVARAGTATRIRMKNDLQDANGNALQHIIPVDVTLPGAELAQNRIAIHQHGGYMPWICDGGPYDWWDHNGTAGISFQNGPGSVLDRADDPIPPGCADFYYPNVQGTRLVWYHDHAHGTTRLNAYAGLASGYLILDARHDAYVSDGKIPGLASTLPLIFQDKVFVSSTTALTDPTWATVARPDVQSPGSLWYEHVYNPREFKLLRGGAYTPPPNPSCIPEFFGDTMLCNGTVYPFVQLEAKRYRFHVLNACNARFLNINLFVANPKNADGIDLDPLTLFPLNPPGPPMIQIGNECGFLKQEVVCVSPRQFNPATLSGNLLVAPAERADLIIDLTGLAGKDLILYNDAPGPFPMGPPTTDYYLGNPKNPVQPLTGRDKLTGEKWATGPDTRQLLRIKVVAAAKPDSQPPGPILDPTRLDPAPIVPYPTDPQGALTVPVPPLTAADGTPVRPLTLNEDFDKYGRLRQLLGTTTPNGLGGFGLDYLAPATEIVQAGSTEVWEIYNLTADTHPIHFHLVNVQVLSRQPFVLSKGAFLPTGIARGPELNEVGWKETVQMHPGEVTRVIMKFDLAPDPKLKSGEDVEIPSSARATDMGLPAGKKYHEYVWHCHILEHEEHDMMRPLIVAEEDSTA